MITGSMVRERVGRDILDYQQLSDVLSGYAKPRDRIRLLLRKKELIRVRKGLYIVGEAERRHPVCREYLANLIYGPSYVSLEYALAYHGLIPESVSTVTSVTMGSPRRFSTPFGLFTYRHLSTRRYAIGATRVQAGQDSFLMASPEKALADKVWADKRLKATSQKDFRRYLLEDLRVDMDAVADFNEDRIRAVESAFSARKIKLLFRAVECIKREAV